MTHIPTMVKIEDQGAFHNRKGFISQNVLLACSFDMHFQHVLIGWIGFVADSCILDSVLLIISYQTVYMLKLIFKLSNQTSFNKKLLHLYIS